MLHLNNLSLTRKTRLIKKIAGFVSFQRRGGSADLRYPSSAIAVVARRTARSVFASLAIACASTTSAATLTTPLAGGNENDGVMFDIKTGANALTLTSIGANIIGTANYNIYFKTDSITIAMSGNSSDPAAWTLLGQHG